MHATGLRRCKLRTVCSGLILIAVLTVSAAFLSSCSGRRVPGNYVARSIVGENIVTNQLGIPMLSDHCQEIYVYKNKSYITVTYEKERSEISSRISIQGWQDLLPVLGDPVIMEEGDIPTLSKERFISYMETLYP